jgi:hypothetical protein
MEVQSYDASIANRACARMRWSWWRAFLLASMTTLLCVGCATTPARQGPQTVQEFVGQPRPGNGILGK